jgi:hypothetical protein
MLAWSKYSCGASVVFEQTTQAVTTLNLTALRDSFLARIGEEQLVSFPLMVSFLMIQVGNRTPILGNYETFVIHGIPGVTAR